MALRSEGGRESSRQKSCNACVRSKRRCDKRTPTCGRCAKRRYLCVYGGLPGKRRDGGDTAAEEIIHLDCLPDLSGNPPCGDAPMFDPGLMSTPLEPGLDLMPATPASFRLDSAFDNLLSSMTDASFEDWSWHPSIPRQQSEAPSSPDEKTLTMDDYSHMATMCGDYHPWHAVDPSTKISFTLKIFRELPVDFARDNRTPYLHRFLYKDHMPQFITQAFCMCVLYAHKTDENRGLMLRVLHDNVTSLLSSSKATSLTPYEKLARVHALIFYQIIRMFDGDITLGQQANNDFNLLEAWIDDLRKLRDNLTDCVGLDEATLRNNPPQSWERWVFAESLRRTVMMGYALKSISELLRGLVNKPVPLGNWASVHRWTLSGHLWDAQNSFDFFQAWSVKPFWIISAFKFEEFLQTGTGDDLDDFARNFLTVYFGVNEMKTFCYKTSGRQQIM